MEMSLLSTTTDAYTLQNNDPRQEQQLSHHMVMCPSDQRSDGQCHTPATRPSDQRSDVQYEQQQNQYLPSMLQIIQLAPNVQFPICVFDNVIKMCEKSILVRDVRWSEIPGMNIRERKRLEAENDELHKKGEPHYRRLYSCPSFGHIRRSDFCALHICCLSNNTKPVREYVKRLGIKRTFAVTNRHHKKKHSDESNDNTTTASPNKNDYTFQQQQQQQESYLNQMFDVFGQENRQEAHGHTINNADDHDIDNDGDGDDDDDDDDDDNNDEEENADGDNNDNNVDKEIDPVGLNEYRSSEF